MDQEIRRIIDEAYAESQRILEQYRPQLVQVAEYLLAHETMTGQEFEAVFAPAVEAPIAAESDNEE